MNAAFMSLHISPLHIEREGKCCGCCLRADSILHIVLEQLILFLKPYWCKIASVAIKWTNSVPQTAATTFVFSSIFILLLCTTPTICFVFEQEPEPTCWLPGRYGLRSLLPLRHSLPASQGRPTQVKGDSPFYVFPSYAFLTFWNIWYVYFTVF